MVAPQKKVPLDLRSLARSHTVACVETLSGIMRAEQSPPSARVQAAGLLLERGWGKAPQPLTGENGEGEITIVIRRLMDEDALKTVEGRTIKTIDQVVRQGDEVAADRDDG